MEYILFDKTNPSKAIEKVVSYVSRLKLNLEIETQKREEIAMIAVSALIVMFAIILYFAFRRK